MRKLSFLIQNLRLYIEIVSNESGANIASPHLPEKAQDEIEKTASRDPGSKGSEKNKEEKPGLNKPNENVSADIKRRHIIYALCCIGELATYFRQPKLELGHARNIGISARQFESTKNLGNLLGADGTSVVDTLISTSCIPSFL